MRSRIMKPLLIAAGLFIAGAAALMAIPATQINFEGVGNNQYGFTVSTAPPDANLAVGLNHIVQVVNDAFAVFNKSGALLYGPVPTNSLWSGFGGGCATNNDGDAIVKYDAMADRWVIAQPSVSTTPYLYCIAVSQTADPTGSYFLYSFQYSDFPGGEPPKLAVWPDAYYATFDMFAGGSTFSGGLVCAYDRSMMLRGGPAAQQCFNVGTNYRGLLPSDLDGSTLPPPGSPNYILALGVSNNDLALWKFHVDWSNTLNTTLTGPATLIVASYTAACNGGTCIPQAGTGQQLDSLGDRLMYRLAYRNFGGHESMVVNHSVTAGSSTGIRWYEIRSPGNTPTIFQQGTYAPDPSYRWMGSIAMDGAGNMGLGFSLSGSNLNPEIKYTGRLAADAPGAMTQGEGTLINGAGSQNGGLTRWGDISSMVVDPADDCTFWYTNEYIPSIGSFNWHTRIGSFKFPGCGVVPPPNDFAISVSPASLTLNQGGSGTLSVSTAVTSGSAQTINLSVSGLPSGVTASFNPTSVTAGGSSTLTISSGTAAAGTYTLTVKGTGPSGSHASTVTLTIAVPPPPNDFAISVSPASLTLDQGQSGTLGVGTAVTSGSAQTINLSVSGLPSGVTASFNPASVTAGGSSILSITADTAAPAGTYTITVAGTEGSATHSSTLTLTIVNVSMKFANFSCAAIEGFGNDDKNEHGQQQWNQDDNKNELHLKCDFTLGAGSHGISPSTTDAFKLTIAAATISLPAGSFHNEAKNGKPASFTFEGKDKNGAELEIEIEPKADLKKGPLYHLQVDAQGANLGSILTGTQTVTVTLTIGNNSGTTTVKVKNKRDD